MSIILRIKIDICKFNQYFQIILRISRTLVLLPDSRFMLALLKFLANGTTSSPTLYPCSSQDRSENINHKRNNFDMLFLTQNMEATN